MFSWINKKNKFLDILPFRAMLFFFTGLSYFCCRLTFDDIALCQLPRETRLCITLIGLRTVPATNSNTTESQKVPVPLGGVTIQLFNKRGYVFIFALSSDGKESYTLCNHKKYTS